MFFKQNNKGESLNSDFTKWHFNKLHFGRFLHLYGVKCKFAN